MDGLLRGPKTDRDCVQSKTQSGLLNGMGLKGKVAPPGIEPRASGLSRQCSATELRRPVMCCTYDPILC